jgi:hypothetical protein
MRARDARAIGFCILSSGVLLGGTLVLAHSYLAALALTAAWDAWLLTRPRMIRVFRRLRGEPDWSGYFDNGGDETRRRAPAGSASSPRRAGPP